MFSIIDDDSESLLQSLFSCTLLRYIQQVTQQSCIVFLCILKFRHVQTRDDEEVDRCLWTDVVECNTLVVLVDELRGDFLVQYFGEDGVASMLAILLLRCFQQRCHGSCGEDGLHKRNECSG